MDKIVKNLSFFVLLTAAFAAQAVPVTFSWNGTVVTTNMSGVAVNDIVTINVFADNGGGSTLSQVWNGADVTSATLTAGSYTATYFPPNSFGDPMFTTNALGDVIQSMEIFCCSNPANFDSLGGIDVNHSRNAASSSTGYFFWDFDAGQDTWAAHQWTVTPTTSVPAPAGVLLMLVALVALSMKRDATS